MAVIAIEMLREHRYPENARTTRVLPLKWRGELDEEAAAYAIAIGAARPRSPLTKDQALAVEILKAAKANDYDRIDQLRQENPDLLPTDPAPASGETPSKTSESAEASTDATQATTKPRRSR
ncbi:hypothetical protein Hden_1223 [Hyphomicrobium denitrificans ATCC 51888]|uniref:Uncharacterized protein n=1 Tax=Hyphomicrobium denitrificans (strain ATCC 51888 / DSM 1869 / NCIMB 11706 / TK 0415) TaxID=582899 RepID=D8JWC2_HYPDA|nr:hypothetical protein [Hyphomicrobium denitrificans]ADJ23035.1 hypothetical protein Hden_1223 [Hyphomicrobium denitrificans ATCC 51888]